MAARRCPTSWPLGHCTSCSRRMSGSTAPSRRRRTCSATGYWPGPWYAPPWRATAATASGDHPAPGSSFSYTVTRAGSTSALPNPICFVVPSTSVTRARMASRHECSSVFRGWRMGCHRHILLHACRPQDLQFSRGKRGKPAVAGPQEALQGSHLHFSLSHTQGLLGGRAHCQRQQCTGPTPRITS